MSTPELLAKLDAQTRAQVDAFLDLLTPAIHQAPGAPGFPLSLLLLAPSADCGQSLVQWLHLCDATVPQKPDAWAHAVHLTRDLLVLLAKLDTDFDLGMGLPLAQLMGKHPLLLPTAPSTTTPH